MTKADPGKPQRTVQLAPHPATEAEAKELLASTRARQALNPRVQAALSVIHYNPDFGSLSAQTLLEELRNQCQRASDSDFTQTEAMLVSQAHTLDSIFNRLARDAMTTTVHNFDVLLRLALKAQGQCRASLETLAIIKNPPNIAFVRQANIAQGPQQVNNSPAGPALPRAHKAGNRPNKLLEDECGNCLDSVAKSEASKAHRPMATVEAINRTANDGGKSSHCPERLQRRNKTTAKEASSSP